MLIFGTIGAVPGVEEKCERLPWLSEKPLPVSVCFLNASNSGFAFTGVGVEAPKERMEEVGGENWEFRGSGVGLCICVSSKS